MSKRSRRNKRRKNVKAQTKAKEPTQVNQKPVQKENAFNQGQDNSEQNNLIPDQAETLSVGGGNDQKDARKNVAKNKNSWTRGDIIGAISVGVALIGIGVALVIADMQSRQSKEDKGDTNIYYAGQPIDLSYSDASYRAGQEFFDNGEFDKALDKFDEAAGRRERQSVADINLARIQYAMGVTYKYKGDYEAAIDNYTIAVGTLKSLEEAEKSDDIKDDIKYEMGYVHYLRGMAYIDSHQLEKGKIDLGACLDEVGYFRDEAGVEKWYDMSSVHNAFGELYFASAYSECSPYDTGEVLGYTFQDAYDTYNLALILKGLDKASGAEGEILTYEGSQIEEFDRLGIYPKPNEKGPPDFLELYNWLMCGWYKLSDIDMETADILLNRAKVVGCMGYSEPAMYDCETALKVYEKIGPSVRSKVADVYFEISQIMLEQSARDGVLTDEAKKQFVKYMTAGVEYNEKWLGRGFDTARLYEGQGGAFLLDEQWDNAIEAFEKAKRIFADLELSEEVQKEEEFIKMANEMKDEGGEWRMERIEVAH